MLREVLEKERKARELDNVSTSRADRPIEPIFIPTLQFDRESLFGHIYVDMCPNMSN